MKRYEDYERCPECEAVLFKDKITNQLLCELCGWSSPIESKDDKPPSYVG